MCGVFGIRASDRDVARLTYFALYALQHRGQESAGIAVTDGRHIQAVRELGLVSQVFDESTLETLEGVAAVGHARYSTTGSSRWQNAQPVIRHRPGRTLSLAHNGNLTNTTELRDELEGRGLKFESTSDTEVIAALICEHDGPLVDGVKEAMSRIVGAFAAIVMDEEQLIGFRDPDGIRPLVLGDLDGHPVLASETCALDIVGATFVRDIEPGEIVVSFTLPARPAGSSDAYLRLIPRTEMDIAVVGCGVSLTMKGGTCTAARVGLGAVAPTVLLVEAAAKALIGTKLDAAALEAAAAACRAVCKPIDDKRGTIVYRTKIAGVLLKRATAIAAERAAKN